MSEYYDAMNGIRADDRCTCTIRGLRYEWERNPDCPLHGSVAIAREATEIAHDLTAQLLTIFGAHLDVLRAVNWDGMRASFARILAALDAHEHRPRMKDRAARRRAGFTRTGRPR
ncbi:hypothetical protein [Gordonia sp. MMO-8]|uniref:hypothetical protein n=1 Tax=Gordonia sp. MMO-8 TaxID=3127886 RepID=UPI003019AC10